MNAIKELMPRACRPSSKDATFVNIIVKMPILQVLSISFGVTHLVIELVPPIQKTAIYRSLPLKAVTLTLQAFLAGLYYEVRCDPVPS